METVTAEDITRLTDQLARLQMENAQLRDELASVNGQYGWLLDDCQLTRDQVVENMQYPIITGELDMDKKEIFDNFGELATPKTS